jgi:thiamine-phosphate pyrophosphorylase
VPRLYLMTPRNPSGVAGLVIEALGSADIAAVLLRCLGQDERGTLAEVESLISAVHDKGAALLLQGHPELAVNSDADGAHLDGVDSLRAALSLLKPSRIAGCGRLLTRHDAMLAGEAGADYVMFGEPDATGERPAFHAVSERVSWWAELFEIPCVGYADSLDEVEALASVGADFVAIGELISADKRGCGMVVAAAAERLRAGESTA